MSFLDCINTAVETGKLGKAKALEAGAAYEEAVAEGKAAGLSDSAAEAAASHASLKAVTELTNAKRWERINEMRAQHALHERIRLSADPSNALANHGLNAKEFSIMEEVGQATESVEYQIMASMAAVINAFDSRLAGFYKPVENMAEAVSALYGNAAGPAAKTIAQAVTDTYNLMTKLLRNEGVDLPENKNFRLSQRHDRFLVHNATKEVWVREHLADGVLDWEVMRYQRKAIPVEKREEILGRVWDAITTEGKNTVHESQNNAMSLASKLGRERFLYYASADSWNSMNSKYGAGNMYEQLLAQVQSTSKYVGLMRSFGPNPKTGAAFAERALEKKVSEQVLGVGAKKAEKLHTAKDRELNSFQSQYAIAAQEVDTGHGDPLVNAANTARLLTGVAMLGGMAVNALSDAFYGMWARTNYFRWGSATSLIPRYIQGVTQFKNFKQQMINDGIGLETVMSMAHGNERFSLGLEGAHWAKQLSEAQYRITGTSRITQVGRGLAGQDFSRMLAEGYGQAFEAHPLYSLFSNIGITAKDWEHLQATALYTPEYYDGTRLVGKGQFLRPIDMWNDAKSQAARDAANKFMLAQGMFIHGAVPGPNIRTRAFTGGAVTSRALHGQAMKTMVQFMAFPASIMFNQWKIAMSAPTAAQKAWRLSSLIAFTTGGGALIQQIKELLKGNKPKPMDTPAFWGKSLVLGGGGAILGDFLYNNIVNANSAFGASTPMGSLGRAAVAPLTESWKAYVLGEEDAKPGAALMQLAWAGIPKPQPYKLALERMLYDPMLQQYDPAAYERKVSAQQKALADNEQESWWATGQ